MADVQKTILGDGSEADPYRIDGVWFDMEYEVVSMDYGTKVAVIRIL